MQGPYQTSYGYQRTPAFAGLIETAKDVISRINATRQLTQVVVGGTTDGLYRILVDGVIKAEYTASSNTAAQIRDALLADLVADGSVTAEASSTDTILIENKSYRTGHTITTTTTGATLTATTLVAHAQTVPFGVGVVMDPRAVESGRQCRLPRLTGEVSAPTFLGVAAADTSLEQGVGGWEPSSAISILRAGRVWCLSETAIVEGSQPFCRFASGAGGSQLGVFRNSADTSTAVQPKGLIAITGVSAAGIFLAEFNPQT